MFSRANNKNKGFAGEEAALNHLLQKGYRLLERNFSTRLGEIDLIMRKEDLISFIEVKWRSSEYSGLPYEAVNYKKQKTIIKTAQIYIQKKQLYDFDFSFDIVSIIGNNIKHFEHAFYAS